MTIVAAKSTSERIAGLNAPLPDELRRWDREIYWHAFTQMAEYEPLILERGEGCLLFDINGRSYIDGVSSLWCNVHGHRHPRLDAALIEQLGKVAHVTSLGSSNSTTIRLAKRLIELAPLGLEHVFFSDNGATAVEVALKMAFQYWRQCPNARPEKSAFLTLGNAYHGDTLGGVSVGGVEHFHKMFEPLLFRVFRAPSPDVYRLPTGVTAENALDHYLGSVERLLAEHHDEIAAIVVESLVQGAAGMIVQPRGYLRGLRELATRFGVLLILDEVAVGFGRTGTMFGCEQEQISPDLLCLAKGLTGGYLPLAATLATDEIYRAFLGRYDEFKTFFHGHTYGGNPLGAAVALATLDVFDEEQTLAKLPPKITQLSSRLAEIANLPHVGDVRQCGMMAGIELVRDVTTREPYDIAEQRGYRVCAACREMGVLLRPLGNVIVVMPPLSIAATELDLICDAAAAAIQRIVAEPY